VYVLLLSVTTQQLSKSVTDNKRKYEQTQQDALLEDLGGIGTCFPPGTSVYPVNSHSTNRPTLIIILLSLPAYNLNIDTVVK
jgi:hypothetical protein